MDKLLEKLALLHGVLPEHEDGFGRHRKVAPETLFETLRALGVASEILQDVPAALRERHWKLGDALAEPVVVVWEKNPIEIELRILEKESAGLLKASLACETGELQSFNFKLKDLPNQGWTTKKLSIPFLCPLGYHRLTLETSSRRKEILIISSPREAFLPPDFKKKNGWGAFVPLYALHSRRSWGAGDFSDLERFSAWVGERGGKYAATLPFLAAFLEESFNPSPYSPVSRLFWNEFYLDLTKVPELELCPRAKEIMNSSELERELQELRAASLVDYRRLAALKRTVLQELAQAFFARPSPRRNLFEEFLKSHPNLQDYARFRAVHEKLKTPWSQWPSALREGKIQPGDYPIQTQKYHLYVQWVAEQQVKALVRSTKENGLSLFLDFPLGVHPDGFDVWREREIFVSGVSAGAPPDGFFTQGQNWGCPPLHPEKIREQGYRYFIDALRHHLEQAGILRIDHVMGFHRLYWIPAGMKATEGCYVRYSYEEFYAILCLESHRSQTLIVGEDLGTVPPETRPAMKAHRVFQTYVAQFGLTGNPSSPFDPIPSQCVAGLNTHDTATFSGFWEGLDIEARKGFGRIDSAEADRELLQREKLKRALVLCFKKKGWVEEEGEIFQIFRACLKHLASSQASLILINLEDFWQEIRPQNMPGTWEERPNWVGKTRLSFEEFRRMPEVLETLKEIHRLRGRSEGPSSRP